MSKKVSCNNYAQALKIAKAYEEANGVKPGTLTDNIPEEINEADGKNHFHVLLVKKRHDAKNQKYIVTGTLQTFGKGPAFDKLKKNFATQGFTTIIIVHDPSQNNEADGTLKRHEKSAIERQIEAEEKAEMQKRINKRKADALAEAEKAKAKEVEEANKEAEKQAKLAEKNKSQKLEFEGMEVTEENIDQFIQENKIDASEAKTPEGKLAIVKKWIDEQTK